MSLDNALQQLGRVRERRRFHAGAFSEIIEMVNLNDLLNVRILLKRLDLVPNHQSALPLQGMNRGFGETVVNFRFGCAQIPLGGQVMATPTTLWTEMPMSSWITP